MKRFAMLTYGVVSYALFFAVFCYAYGWVGNILVPLSIDSAPAVPLGAALLVNVALLAIFAIQHSVMARPTFKKWWTTIIPEASERSTYVLISSVLMIVMFWLWQPMGGVIWEVQNTVARGVLLGIFTSGWVLILLSSFSINHFDLFGLRQVWLYFQGKPYTQLKFDVPILYKFVRHPLYVGWLLAFWMTPKMTVAHLVFAIVTTLYILVAIQLEERNLEDALPGYSDYKKRTPMLIPFTKRGRKTSGEKTQTKVA
ncbi:MAG: isoprenylcysteine carboxylmethyltransferase family protein [Planctomycetota bacterium]|nr:isoprenylcysteine carboxylmethyltransferase family protein [Planctomycetota bacterium]